MRKRILIMLAAMVAALSFSGASPVSADPVTSDEVSPAAWICSGDSKDSSQDSGGRDVIADCTSNAGSGSVSAEFLAYGEDLRVCDHYPNGYATWVRLTVVGEGSSMWRSYRSNRCTTYTDELSFDEGLDVIIRVCTSDQTNAQCRTQSGGRT